LETYWQIKKFKRQTEKKSHGAMWPWPREVWPWDRGLRPCLGLESPGLGLGLEGLRLGHGLEGRSLGLRILALTISLELGVSQNGWIWKGKGMMSS
jgi:hypothetical protein